jgi:uncharacterized protein (TIGR03435 family)
MQEMDDMALLREFATNNSEAAFETLVSRHVNFVYSAALRQVRDPHLAKEVTQAAFIILAQKAGGLSDKTILTGWLYRTARFAALAQARAAAKRRQREQEANMQSEIQPSAPDVCWEQMSPLLDEALATLGEKDRQAVLLRFFENKSLAEVGSSLGMGEDTARKRVARALGKLHRYFSSHGVVSTAAMIAGSISANSVQAAPVALTKFITAAGIVKGAASGASTLTLIKGALRIMAWTKAKTAIVVGVGILLTVGTAMVAVKQIQMHGIYRGSWQVKEITLDESILDRMPPMVQILPTKFARFNTVKDGIGIRRARGNKMAGLRQPVSEIILTAYGGGSPVRVVAGTGLPPDEYDFVAAVPDAPMEALQREIKNQFGLVARHETRETNVWLLRVRNPNAPGLRPISGKPSANTETPGRISAVNSTLLSLSSFLEEAYFKLPVIDQTGLAGRFDYDLKWNADDDGRHHNLDGLKQALIDQLGLELVPGREPVDMLVIEKARN